MKFIDPLLKYRYNKVPLEYNMTIGEFIERYPKGIYLITMVGHITVVKNGVLYDTFDCRHRNIKDVWKVF